MYSEREPAVSIRKEVLVCLYDIQLPLIFVPFSGSSIRGYVMTNHQELRNTLNGCTTMNAVS